MLNLYDPLQLELSEGIFNYFEYIRNILIVELKIEIPDDRVPKTQILDDRLFLVLPDDRV
jgi:hypothetical protein